MRSFYLRRFITAAAMAAGTLGALSSLAAPFTPGNIVVARVGDGSAALTTAAAAVYLDEYTPAGALVQSIALPTSVSGNNRILTASGTTTTELSLTRSSDGRYLVLAGYGAAPGTPSIATSPTNEVARVIALIGVDGSVDTSTSAGDAFDGGSIRGAATADGTGFYSVGSKGGVYYQAFGDYTSTQLAAAPAAARSINVANGNVYISTVTSPYFGLAQVGSGLSTASGQAVTALPGFPGTTSGSSPNSFYLADLSADVPGPDVAYVADDRTAGGIQKWSLVNSAWTLNGTIAGSASAQVRGLSGATTGTTVSLAATSSGSLFVLTDNTGYNTAPSLAALPSAAAVAAANTALRGAAYAPVAPAPAIASFTPSVGGAGTTITITGTNFTGATAVSIGSLAVPTFTVVSATSITFTVPTSASSVNGPLTVVTPGGTATSTASFNLTLATLANQALPGLGVYPNPATDYISIKLPNAGAATAALRDLTGRLVLSAVALTPDKPLRLPATLPAGIYWLEVQQGTVKAMRRIEKL